MNVWLIMADAQTNAIILMVDFLVHVRLVMYWTQIWKRVKVRSILFRKFQWFTVLWIKIIKVCPFKTYGVNCSQTCQCPNAKSCDNIIGCICNTGYSGINCTTLIDGCLSKNFLY